MPDPLQTVDKPKERSTLRKYLGKEYFIAKRQLKWFFGVERYSSVDKEEELKYSLKKHQSFLLRPLKNVEMYLQHNKVKNLGIAAGKIDRVIIKPGETFSIWKLVGRPTKEKGYLEGLTLDNGKISKGIGGGLCQMGNLLYWLFLHTPLTITERWRHGYDVFPDINRTIPFACGATLSYNYIDLQVKNETSATYQIRLWLDGEYLHGEIKSDKEPDFFYEIQEKDHFMKLQWWGAYTRHNKIWRKKINKNNGVLTEELVAENQAIMMYSPLLT